MEEKHKTKIEKYGAIHRIAHCKDCTFQAEGYRTSHLEAKKHVQKTGHTVAVETGDYYDILPCNPKRKCETCGELLNLGWKTVRNCVSCNWSQRPNR